MNSNNRKLINLEDIDLEKHMSNNPLCISNSDFNLGEVLAITPEQAKKNSEKIRTFFIDNNDDYGE